MKVAIVLVAKDTDILTFFDKRKGAVVPRELRKDNVQFSTFPVDAVCSDGELLKILLKAHKKHDAVGVLVEAGSQARLNNCTCAMFLKTFSSAEAKSSMKNYFDHSLNRWLKNLLFLTHAFADGKQRKCLLLPERNFAASELGKIFQLCRMQNDKGRFPELLEADLKAIRERSIPKKEKSGNKHFLKDDNDRYFELGKERHGQSETGRPPHAPECQLTALARFGVTVDRYLHFNVTLKAEQISGAFQDCHAASKNVLPCTHINMFPNGFMR